MWESFLGRKNWISSRVGPTNGLKENYEKYLKNGKNPSFFIFSSIYFSKSILRLFDELSILYFVVATNSSGSGVDPSWMHVSILQYNSGRDDELLSSTLSPWHLYLGRQSLQIKINMRQVLHRASLFSLGACPLS